MTGKVGAARLVLLVATRKGAWIFHGDRDRENWRVEGPHFLGHIINHLTLDPRDGRTLLAAAKTGHLGPTIFRSTDLRRGWREAAQPPAFGPARNGLAPRAVDHTFWLAPAHATEPGVWYAGTSPQGLFRSGDGGDRWSPFSCINDDARYRHWMGTVQDGTPDGPKLHSIIVDPRDRRHLYFAMSGGGVHESLDGGETFAPLVDGMEVVAGFDPGEIAFHDPHCLRLCPANPDRLYQQNHCGIYRLDRPAKQWVRIGRTMPAGGLWHPGRRRLLAAPGPGAARRASLVDRQAPGHGRRWPGSRGAVFRHQQRRTLAEPRRGPLLAVPGAAPAGDTVAAVLDDLVRQYPGIRFRMVDEQGRICRHIRLFCGGRALQGLGDALADDQELCIVQALSGG
jgi:hypothetical protein